MFLARMYVPVCLSVCSLWGVLLCSVRVSIVSVGVCCSLTHRCVYVCVCVSRGGVHRGAMCALWTEKLFSHFLNYCMRFLF